MRRPRVRQRADQPAIRTAAEREQLPGETALRVERVYVSRNAAVRLFCVGEEAAAATEAHALHLVVTRARLAACDNVARCSHSH